jgi:hypothetical protein
VYVGLEYVGVVVALLQLEQPGAAVTGDAYETVLPQLPVGQPTAAGAKLIGAKTGRYVV